MIIFEFERVLLNTTLLKEDIKQVFEKFEIEGQDFWKSFYHSYDLDYKELGSYSIDRHLNLLKNLTKGQRAAIKRDVEIAVLNRGRGYLYPDVVEFLSQLRERQIKMVLLSQGNASFQKLKLEATGMKEYFDTIIIFNNSLATILKRLIVPKSEHAIVYIGKKISRLKDIRRKYPFITIFYIRRENQSPPQDLAVGSIFSLNELSWCLRTLSPKKLKRS